MPTDLIAEALEASGANPQKVATFLRAFNGNMLRIEVRDNPHIGAVSVPVVALHALADAVERAAEKRE